MKRLLCVLLLSGCASYNFADALGAGYATVDTLAETALELCAAETIGGPCTGPLPTDARDEVRAQLTTALEYLDQARGLQVDGSGDLAQQRIEQSRVILRAVATALEKAQ